MSFGATRELWRTGPKSKSVFNRQVRPKRYLFPISQPLRRSRLSIAAIAQDLMTSFHQFSVLAASRNEGLHPKLQALLERAAASPFSEVSMRKDGLIQAGPSPDSEVVSSRGNVTPFLREPAGAVVAALKPEMQGRSTVKRDRLA
jgi:hypothetical protein